MKRYRAIEFRSKEQLKRIDCMGELAEFLNSGVSMNEKVVAVSEDWEEFGGCFLLNAVVLLEWQ